jgi:hypothetical protein
MKTCLTTAILALSLALISCSGGKDNPAPPPPPQVSIGITPNTATAKPTKSVELVVTARNTDIIFPADVQGSFTVTNNKVIYTPPSIAGTYEFAVTASADTTKKATARITVDDSRTKGYLIQSLAEVCKDIVNKEIPESEWSAKGQLIQDAFVHGWQYDSYSVNIPFTTDEIRNGVSWISFEFPYDSAGQGGTRWVKVGTLEYDNNPVAKAQTVLHEIGHAMGLSEQLTELLTWKFVGGDTYFDYMQYGTSPNFHYNPYFYNMLLEKVGDTQFCQTVFRTQYRNQGLANLWDLNMTINRAGNISPLVTHYDFWAPTAISISTMRPGSVPAFDDALAQFLAFSGIISMKEEFAKLPKLFHDALIDNNASAQHQVEDFFAMFRNFYAVYDPRPWSVDPIHMQPWSGFLQDTRSSASQSMPDAA